MARKVRYKSFNDIQSQGDGLRAGMGDWAASVGGVSSESRDMMNNPRYKRTFHAQNEYENNALDALGVEGKDRGYWFFEDKRADIKLPSYAYKTKKGAQTYAWKQKAKTQGLNAG